MKITFKRSESREKLARKIGITQQHLYRIEKQGYVPSLNVLIKLSQLCGVIKIDDEGKQYLFVPLDIEHPTIDSIEYMDVQKEAEDVIDIPKETLVKAFKQNDPDAQKAILKECQEAYEALGEALCS